jgi:II/X family phage/plasmid replication protein
MQGHNIFGSVDFCDCALRLIVLLCSKYPVLASKLDFSSWSLVQIDVTYASRAKNDKEAKRFINALGKVSSGQIKSSTTDYDGTAYFGKKNSRLKKVKVYAKHPEVLAIIKKNEKKKDVFEYSEQLLEFSKGMIRWELSLYHRYFKRAGIPCELSEIIEQNCFFSPQMLRGFWRNGLSQLFKALEGQEMKVVDNNAVLDALRAQFSKTSPKTGKVSTTLADSVFRTYLSVRRDGWDATKSLMDIRNFNRHVKHLCECGLSRAALQNMNGLDDGSKIVSFAEFMQVDFDVQHPDWYVPEPPKYTREMFLNDEGKFDFAEGLKNLIGSQL